MICVTMVGLHEYEVVVEKPTETIHRVTLAPDYYQKLCGATVTHEWLIIQAFRLLLEREPNTAILSRFDLADISRYFPDFEDALAARIGR
jgi:hypothetical protein